MLSIYLAGPDVFYPDAVNIGEDLKSLCAKYGFKGIFPLDLLPSNLFTGHYSKREQAVIIKNACVNGIKASDILVANLTPFRGISMDVGTAFEMGFADALGLPVYGYSDDDRHYLEKVLDSEFCGELYNGNLVDRKGQIIEDLNHIDNCMVTEACGNIFYPDTIAVPKNVRLTAIEKTLKYISSYAHQ